ncbi:hypothetical protein AAII07_01995 [Microvirga sp. 0TCS3.31]
MSMTVPSAAEDPHELATLQQVHQQWNSGNQAPAIEALRPLAEEHRPWAVALMAWLRMQQGYPGIEQSIPLALEAAELGMPWQAVHTFNNVVAHLPSNPQMAERLPELAEAAQPWPSGIDPIGQGWNLLGQGQPEWAMRLMSMTGFWPAGPADWEPLVAQARARLQDLENLTASAREERERVSVHAGEALGAITKASDDLQTSAKQAGLLVTASLSDATNALFKADAERNETESRSAWRAGLAVLGAAALVAVLPLLLHYLGAAPSYSATAEVGAHAASTLALATFAGVLLARARSRDQAAQRANDLSTAMGTMISYSNQISDPAEKQRFMMTMGQLVLQAHLTVGGGHHGKDESLSGMLALANLVRATPPSTPSSGT